MDQYQEIEANSNIIVPPPLTIHVMVVDDDTTSLALVSNLLKTLNYQVALFNDPIRALYTLRAGKHSFDLIMTALYMPKMDGFELTRRVNDEFKLPVIMISTDDRESVMFRAIEEGVVLYLLKPFSPNDLRNIWQFVITTKSRSSCMIPSPNLLVEDHQSRSRGVEFRAVETRSAVSSNSSSNKLPMQEGKKKNKKKDSNGKLLVGNEDQKLAKDKKDILTPAKKKAKVIWTDFLQYRFLHAVHYIGLDRAVPKKILEVMNVPGLTRENVASHLQKYRIFLRKVAERCMITSEQTSEEMIWSKFLCRHASLVLEKIQQKRAFSNNYNSSHNLIITNRPNPNQQPNPNTPTTTTTNHNNNNNNDRRRFTHGQLSFAKNLSPYGLAGHNGSLGTSTTTTIMPFNGQINNNNNIGEYVCYNDLGGSSFNYNQLGFSTGVGVGVGGDMSGAVHNSAYNNGNNLDAIMAGTGSVGNFQADDFGQYGQYGQYGQHGQHGQYGQYGVGSGGDNNSYNNWGLMCNNINNNNNNNDGVNFVGDQSHTTATIGNTTHAAPPNIKVGGQEDSGLFAALFPLENFAENPTPNQEAGSGGFMTSDQSYLLHNMYADEESPADPFSIDEQVLEEFLASLLKTDNPAEA